MRSHINDFDFLTGTWRVSHCRLKERLAGCQEWEKFAGASSAQKILGGSGNMDDNVLELPGGAYRAVSLRTFDLRSNLWSIWWLDGRYPTKIDNPVVGGFENGVGTFATDDVVADKPLRVRFLWTRTDTAHPRWEQAFSEDGGVCWECNWTMDFTRI
jgi:hypothetical protein